MINENIFVRNYLTYRSEYKSDTTLQSFSMKPIDVKFQNNSSIDIGNNHSTTFTKKEIIYSDLWDEMSHAIKDQQDKKTTQIVSALEQQLFLALKNSNYERDSVSPAEQLIVNISEEHSFRILGEVVQHIYLKYNDDPNVLVNLCESLERFDGDEVIPWGSTMLMGLLGHKSDSVKEAALSLTENWVTIQLLPALRNIDCTKDWMKAYINDIVRFLEERSDVLCTEAV